MYEQRRNQNCKEKKKRNHSQEKYDGDQAAKSSSFVLYKKKKIDKEPEFKTLEIREADILFERKASSSKKKKNKEDDNNQIIVHGDPVAEKKKKKDHKEPKKTVAKHTSIKAGNYSSSDPSDDELFYLEDDLDPLIDEAYVAAIFNEKSIIVEGLDISVPELDRRALLRNHFSLCGRIKRVTIHGSYAYISFYDVEASKKALALNQSIMDGVCLTVEIGKEIREPKTPSTPHTSGTTTLFAGNLSFQIEEANMREFFKSAGEIVDVRFGVDSDGRFKRYGFIEFESEAAAHKALKLNEQELLGCPIRLDLATAKGAYTTSSGFGSGGRFGNYGGRGDKAGRRGGRRGFNKPNLTAPGTGKPTTYTRFR